MIEPRDDFSVVVGFLDGDLGHGPVGCGAVPVLLAGLDVDGVARAHLLDGAAAACDVADAVGDIQRLTAAESAPGSAGARREADVGAADGGLAVGVANTVDVDGAREPVTGAGGGLTAAGGNSTVESSLAGCDVRSPVGQESSTLTTAVMLPES